MKNNQLIFSKYKDQLLKKGYVVIRNFFNDKESEELKKIIYNIHNKFTEEYSPTENSYTGVKGIHNYRECWEFICNRKILDTLNSIIGENVYYLYNSNTSISTDKVKLEQYAYSWHRDSACRQFGLGPDWNNKEEIYKVVRVGVYLFDSKDIKSGLNIIPNSHRTSFSLNNVLRLLHYRLKNKKNKYVEFFRSVLSKFIGLNIKTNKGDIVIFLANLMHSGIPTKKPGRVSAFLSYGPNNKHSKNYVNYYTKHRKGWEFKDEETQIEFSDRLRKENIFLSLPKKKEDIEFASIPLSER